MDLSENNIEANVLEMYKYYGKRYGNELKEKIRKEFQDEIKDLKTQHSQELSEIDCQFKESVKEYEQIISKLKLEHAKNLEACDIKLRIAENELKHQEYLRLEYAYKGYRQAVKDILKEDTDK